MKYNILAIAALLAAMASSCDKEPQSAPESILPADNVIRVTARVGDPATRAGVTTSSLKEFGMVVTNTTNSAYSYKNVFLLKDGDGIWNSYNTNSSSRVPLMMLWEKADRAVTISTYAPYASTLSESDGTLKIQNSVKTSQADGGASSDLIGATAVVTPATPNTSNSIYYDASVKKLIVSMKHRLSKLRVNLKFGDELTQDGTNPTIKEVRLGGTIVEYKAGIDATSSVELTSTTPYDITMQVGLPESGYDAVCEAVVVPQAATIRVQVRLEDKGFSYVASESFSFESGKVHELTLLVGKDIVKLGDVTAKPWTDGTDSSLETE